MITIRLSKHWRVRRSEWMLSFITLSLGTAWLGLPGLFAQNHQWFNTMLGLFTQETWGTIAVTLGTARLALLVINGTWRASPHLRCLGACLSCILWNTLFIATLSAEAWGQSLAFWPLFFFFDALSALDASGDARVADQKAAGSAGAH